MPRIRFVSVMCKGMPGWCQRVALCAGLLAFAAAPTRAQNLLVNGSFAEPPATPCAEAGAPYHWTTSSLVLMRNSTANPQPCPDDGYYATFISTCGGAKASAFQTVAPVIPGQVYMLHGSWANALIAYPPAAATITMELHDGTDPGGGASTAATISVVAGQTTSEFTPFVVAHCAGRTSLTVVWRVDVVSGWADFVCHADDLSLDAASTAPLSVSSIVDNAGGGATAPSGRMANVTVTGTGFVSGNTSLVLRRDGLPTITGTGIQVTLDGESLTCDLDLTNAVAGLWTVAVTAFDCMPATLPDGFEVTEPLSPVVADCDDDGDVDLSDFGLFLACFNGPGRPPALPGCAASDLDGDGDVDLADFAVFQACFNGPDRPPACTS